ncbi:hypothetical protein M513_09021 [Trichuris suis]|uniref:Retrotransposon gag domain-containing protein n=1 Tax=Trichuris suis TaxID=68888 RepID=A0A085LYL5_9BILA|nr:hypothetical protein M513_09021 [Trichuris suis]
MSKKCCTKSESVVIEGQLETGAGVRRGNELLGKPDAEETVSVGQGRAGSWTQPPHTLSASMDIEVWLRRLDDYLSANAVPEVHWSTDQITSHLQERFGCGESFFTQRLQFSRRTQRPRESIDDFTEDLRCIALQVDKGDRDTMEQFVLGLRDRAAQQHLVDGESMTLDEAVQAAKQFIARHSKEDYRTHPKELCDREEQSIMALLQSKDRRLSKLEVPGHGIERGNVRSHEGQKATVMEQTRSRTNATCFVCASTGLLLASVLCADDSRIQLTNKR